VAAVASVFDVSALTRIRNECSNTSCVMIASARTSVRVYDNFSRAYVWRDYTKTYGEEDVPLKTDGSDEGSNEQIHDP
jgi:hypothetical protein